MAKTKTTTKSAVKKPKASKPAVVKPVVAQPEAIVPAAAKPASGRKDTARKLAIEAARAAEDRNAENIVVLDLRGVSPVTDYFVIATGTSSPQMRAAADEICRVGKDMKQKDWRVAGMDKADWIVLDFVDVVVHLFDQAHREYYDLELIWGASPRVRWQRRAKAPAKKPAQE